jgi:hypothetical protein
MRTPGFGAEKALFAARQGYFVSAEIFSAQPNSGAVITAMAIDGGNPRRECIEDCRDTCIDAGNSPNTCRTKCGRLCTGGPGVGPSPAPNPTNHALCVGGCWAWWAACLADTWVLGVTSGFCQYIRDQCLAGCP